MAHYALGLNQPLRGMSTRNISWRVKAAGRRLTTLPPSCAECLEIWKPQPPGNLRACPGLYRDCFNLPDRRNGNSRMHSLRSKIRRVPFLGLSLVLVHVTEFVTVKTNT